MPVSISLSLSHSTLNQFIFLTLNLVQFYFVCLSGPIIGGYLVDSYLGFRWIFWIMLIWASLALAVVVIFLPETYSPVLLAKRAKKMRKEEPEKNANVWADLERADFT